MNLDEKIQLQVLKLKALAQPRFLIEHAADTDMIPLRQMCAKVAPELYDALENVCQSLDFTKREFIEAAVAEAVMKAEEALGVAAGDLQRELGRAS